MSATSTPHRHPAVRIARVVGGWVVLAVGAALLVLPGPGLLVIAGGLALLATEYQWAANLLLSVRRRVDALRRKARRSIEDNREVKS
jgi:uncharacterized protein (TIGR02611 family)